MKWNAKQEFLKNHQTGKLDQKTKSPKCEMKSAVLSIWKYSSLWWRTAQSEWIKSEYHKKELKNRQERWQSKPLHGQYLQDIKDKTDNDIIWSWLKNGELKKKTEGFLIAAQDPALRTNAIEAKIDKVTEDSKCR